MGHSKIAVVACISIVAMASASLAFAKSGSGAAEIRAAFGPPSHEQISVYTLDNPGLQLDLLGFRDPIYGTPPSCYVGDASSVRDLISAMEKNQNHMAKLEEGDSDGVTDYIDVKSVDVDQDKITVTYRSGDKKKLKKADKESFEMSPCTANFPSK